jgi:carbon starvation protein CstA
VSGFRALIASGTTPKLLENENQARTGGAPTLAVDMASILSGSKRARQQPQGSLNVRLSVLHRRRSELPFCLIHQTGFFA